MELSSMEEDFAQEVQSPLYTITLHTLLTQRGRASPTAVSF